MIAMTAAALVQTANAQSDGIAGDRLVVPLPDLAGLSDDQAQALTRDLAQMNVISSECPGFDVTGPEWQLMTGTTDALTGRLGLNPIAYDREYLRPAYGLLDDPDSCARLGPQVAQTIARLESMGGSTDPVTPGLAPPQADAETPAE